MSNEIEIKKGNEFDINSNDLAELIYESFKEKADALKVQKDIAVKIIKESYNLSNCFLAFSNNFLIGVIGFKRKNNRFLKFQFKCILKYFNIIKTIIYYLILNSNNMKLTQDEIMFESLAVNRDLRGKGIGKKLINYMEQYAQINHYKIISLEVVNTNDIAIKLYKKSGYNIVKEKHFGKITQRAGFTSNLYMVKEIN